MSKPGKSSIAQADSYESLGRFWDEHDLADHWDQTHAVEDAVFDIEATTILFAVDSELASQLTQKARQHGVSPETLLNIWVREKLDDPTSQASS